MARSCPSKTPATGSDQGLTIQSTGTNPCVDVILVHGFGSHSQSTWATKTAFWPGESLPKAIPTARILTYGYVTEKSGIENVIANYSAELLSVIENERTMNKIPFHRPIVFVCYTDGGSIVKKALVFSHGMNDERQFLVNSTRGIICIGLPQNNPDSSWTKISNRLRSDSVSTDPAALDTLRDQMMAFNPIMQRYGFSIKYLHQIDTPSVVPKVADGAITAALMVSGEIPISPIACRSPSETKDEQFLEIEGYIKYILENEQRPKMESDERTTEAYTAESFIPSTPPPTVPLQDHLALTICEGAVSYDFPTHYKVPSQATGIFTGRSAILEYLKNHFFPQVKVSQESEQRRLLLHGVGGSGKTEIARKFAESNCERFWGVFWIDGTNKDTTEESFCKIARDVGIGVNSESVKQWLASQDEEWLLIFDNADEQIDTILGFFPAGKRGSVLVTSRAAPEATARIPQAYEIKGMSKEEARDLLFVATKHHDMPPQKSQKLREKADSIVRELGYMPLAIRIAAACIAKSCEVEHYLRIYQIRKGSPGSPEYSHLSTYTASEVSFGFVSANNPAAANLLRVFAFFGPSHNEETYRQARHDLRTHILSHINHSGQEPEPKKKRHTGKRILDRVKRLMKKSESHVLEVEKQKTEEVNQEPNLEQIPSKLKQILKDYHDDCWDKSQFQDAINTLISFKLIEDNSQKIYSVHRMVHSWIRDRTNVETEEFFREFADRSFTNSIMWGDGTADYIELVKKGVKRQNTTQSISRGLSAPNGLIHITDSKESHRIDVILIHGIDGNERDTWTSKTSDGQPVFWPQDLLPGAFPHARIFSYGYGAKTLDMKNLLGGGATSSESIGEHAGGLLTTMDDERQRELRINPKANKPIIFICHSMGGLVVKQALMNSCLKYDTRKDLINSTVGIIFMGTPHRGSHSACWATVVGSLLKTATLKPNSGLIRALKPSGDILKQQLEHFPDLLSRYKIRIESFYEALPVPWLGTIVPRQSACLGVGERFHAIHANHLTMCRFATADNKAFIAIVAALNRISVQSQYRNPDLAMAAGYNGNMNSDHYDSRSEYLQSRPLSITGAMPNTFNQFREGSYWETGNQGRNNNEANVHSAPSPSFQASGHDWILQDGRYVRRVVEVCS